MCGIIGYAGREDGPAVGDVLVTGLTGLEYRGYDSAGIAVVDDALSVYKREGEVSALEAALEEAVADSAEGGAGSDGEDASSAEGSAGSAGEDASSTDGHASSAEAFDGAAGIGHTRWSTHGPPSDENAHPHTDCTGRVAVVHNGIIENYAPLKDALIEAGHRFESETDTEVLAHLIEAALDGELAAVLEGVGGESVAGEPSGERSRTDGGQADGQRTDGGRAVDPGDDGETTTRSPGTHAAAFRRAVACLEGSYAVAAVFAGDGTIHAARHESPLVCGVGDDGHYLASDVPAFIEYTDRVIYLDDGEFATVSQDGVAVTGTDGAPVDVEIETIPWDPEDAGKSGYDHYMLKEINEQPASIRSCLRGRVEELSGSIAIPELDGIARPAWVQFVACGTSYHAALYGAQLLRETGVPAQAFLASEYSTERVPVPEDTLVIGVTQSGETADTLRALREAIRAGAETLAVTNVVGSSATRECDHTMYIRAGPEIGVAATKTFASQQVALAMVAHVLGTGGTDRASREIVESLRAIPDGIQRVLDESRAREIAAAYVDADAYFFVGRGLDAPVALECALKMKEITYKHAEGFPAGELKHGPLALVTEETPVFAAITGDDAQVAKTLGTVKEVQARGAPVVAVTDRVGMVESVADAVLAVPAISRELTPVLANVQLQLVSYWTANRLGRSIDKPRNLAKSVTVE